MKPKPKQTFCVAHTPAQLVFMYLSMYYNVHGSNSGLGHMEKYVKCAQVSGPNKMLKGWNSICWTVSRTATAIKFKPLFTWWFKLLGQNIQHNLSSTLVHHVMFKESPKCTHVWLCYMTLNHPYTKQEYKKFKNYLFYFSILTVMAHSPRSCYMILGPHYDTSNC